MTVSVVDIKIVTYQNHRLKDFNLSATSK